MSMYESESAGVDHECVNQKLYVRVYERNVCVCVCVYLCVFYLGVYLYTACVICVCTRTGPSPHTEDPTTGENDQ